MISCILQLNVCFEEFKSQFPWNSLHDYIKFDESSYEIAQLYLVLSDLYIDDDIVVDTFPSIFEWYMEKDEYSPTIIFLLTKYCQIPSVMSDTMWDIVYYLLNKAVGKSRAAIIDVYRTLFQYYPPQIIDKISDVYRVMVKPTMNHDEVFSKGCAFMTDLLQSLKFGFPFDTKNQLEKTIIKELESISDQYHESLLACLLSIVASSNQNEIKGYIEEDNIIESVAIFIESDNEKILCITLDVLNELQRIIQLSYSNNILLDYLNDEDLISTIQDYESSENKELSEAAARLLISLEIEND